MMTGKLAVFLHDTHKGYSIWSVFVGLCRLVVVYFGPVRSIDLVSAIVLLRLLF